MSLLNKNWSSKTKKKECEEKSYSKLQKLRKRFSLRLDKFSLSRDDLPQFHNENGNVEITRISMNGNFIINETSASNSRFSPIIESFDKKPQLNANNTIDNSNVSKSPPKPPPRTTSCKSSNSTTHENSSNNTFVNLFNTKPSSSPSNNNKEQNHDSSNDSLKSTKATNFMRPFQSKPLFSKGKSRPKSDMIVMTSSGLPLSFAKSTRFSTFDIPNSVSFGKMEAYVKLDQLGEGSYATVYKGFSNLMNKVVALKEIRLQPEEGAPFTAIREASLLRCLKHANIVTLHDIIHTKETLMFVFEYVDTDLSQYLERHSGGLNPRNVKLFLFQLFRGLAFCHERRILHRDLKPQNLLISEIGELKLADFGLARAKSIPSHTYSHEVVTLWYRPPDVLLGSRNYSTSLDIWGVGCIFIEMVCGAPAFPGVKDPFDQLDKIWRVLGTPNANTWEEFYKLPNHKSLGKFVSYKAQSLTQAFPKLLLIPYGEELGSLCLTLQPNLRISAKDALKHLYFSDLPNNVFDLPNNASVLSIAGCILSPENNNFPLSVMKVAAKMRR